MAKNKVYFPVESLTGLGHLNRTGKLVRDMVAAGLPVDVASGSFLHADRFFAGATCHDIPPLVFKERGQFYTMDENGGRTLVREFNEAARKETRAATHLKEFNASGANILMSEFWPFNRPVVDLEMQALLEASKRQGPASLRVASVRDVLEPLADDKVESDAAGERRADWIVRTINENFDAVLVHSDPNFVPLNETFSDAGRIDVPVIYTGYVVNDLPRRTIGPDDPRAPVVVSCGAGYNCQEMIFSFLSAWQNLVARQHAEPAAASLVNRPVHIICGPRYNMSFLEETQEWAANVSAASGHPITVERYREDFTTLLADAAFSVSSAGYNTTLETLSLNTPALLIPNYGIYGGRMKINPEQLYRLQRLQDKGYAAYAHPQDVQQTQKFSEIMLTEFVQQTAQGKRSAQIDLSGSRKTISAIADLLKDRGLAPAAVATPEFTPILAVA